MSDRTAVGAVTIDRLAVDVPTLAEAADLIRRGALSPVDLTEACLGRIQKYDGMVNAFHNVMSSEARSAAARATEEIAQGRYRGPLHGIPIGLKDVFYMQGHKTTSNSRLMLDFEAQEDATVVRRLKDAGAVLIGQLNTYEFTFAGRPCFDAPFPPARNPWALHRSTGGSSSGSAAAIAAGFCLGALGTDAGGSIRTPAALNGVAGLKPTLGRVSAQGDMPLTFSLDCVGPMAQNSRDCALMLQVIAGYDEKDPMSADEPVEDYCSALDDGVKGLKVGMIRRFYTRDFSSPPQIVAAVDGIGETLANLGAEVGEITLSPLMDWHAVGRIMLPAEAYAIHEERLQTRANDYGRLTRNRLMLGAMIRAVDYIQAQRRRAELLAELEAALEIYDVVVTAGMLVPAAPLDDKEPFPYLDVPMIAVPFSLTGHPAHGVRAGFFADGMPIGAQIAGRNWDEATVLRVAHAFEAAAGLLDRKPDLDSQRI